MRCKKIFALLLSLCMIASLFVAVPVSAADKMTITVGDVEAQAGDTIEVPVTLANNTAGLCGLTLDFTYDPNVLAYKGAAQGSALATMALTRPGSSFTEGSIRFLWDSMDADYSNGVILVITFDVATDVYSNDYDVDVEVKAACDFDFTDIETDAFGGKVTIPGAVTPPVTPPASDKMTITVGDVEAAAGDTIEVPVTLSNNTVGLCGLTLDFTYDPDVLNYKKAVQGEALPDMALTKPGSSFTEGNIRFLWDSMDADYSNGEILVITFDVAANAAGDDYDVDVEVKAACDFDFTDIETDAFGGTVTVAAAAHEHSWDEGEVTTEATCTEKGVMTYTCDCGETKTEDIPVDADAHDWDDGAVTTDATCTETGVMTYTCTACGETKTEDIPVDPDAHNYDDGNVTTDATCTETGVMTYTCDCGDTYTEEFPALGHDMSAVAEIPATCTADGTEAHYVCANCEKTFENEAGTVELTAEELVITAPGHSYGDWAKEDNNNHKKTCSACGDTQREAHTWGAGSITLQPTRTEDGEWAFTCSVCEGTKTETINKVSESDNITNVTVENVRTKSGQEITVPVTISKNAGLVGLILNVEYDKNVLTLTGAEKGTGLGGLELTIPEDLSQQPSIFLWDGLTADSSNGEIVILKFTVAEDAVEGEYPISITVTSACDNALNDVIVCANDGAVNVLNYAPGDLDADGKIGAKDIVLIRRFITAGYNVSIIEDAADVNNDGEIEVKDVVLIRRYIVGGFDVELK